MIGYITGQEGVLSGIIKRNGALSGRVSRESAALSGHIILQTTAEDYKGDYDVTPRVIEQTLLTKNKRLTEDVTVKEIPYFNVSNPQGGETVIIGGEISWQ